MSVRHALATAALVVAMPLLTSVIMVVGFGGWRHGWVPAFFLGVEIGLVVALVLTRVRPGHQV